MATIDAPPAAVTGARISPANMKMIAVYPLFGTVRAPEVNPLWSAARYVGQAVQTAAVR